MNAMDHTLGCSLCGPLRAKWGVQDALGGLFLLLVFGYPIAYGVGWSTQGLLTIEGGSAYQLLLIVLAVVGVWAFFCQRMATVYTRQRVRHHLRWHARVHPEQIEQHLPPAPLALWRYPVLAGRWLAERWFSDTKAGKDIVRWH